MLAAPCRTASGGRSAADAAYDVLVFSKTAGFRHDSIPAGIAGDPGPGRGQQLHRHRDRGRRRVHHRATWPSTRRWSSSPPPATCSTPPSRPRSSATSRAGGGYVGVHAAADTEYDWPFYGNLVGAYFASHPAIQQATRQGRGPGPPGHRAPAADLDPHRRVVQLPHQPALHRARAGHPRRVVVLGRHDGRRPPARLVQDLRAAAGRSTPASATPQESYADPAFRAHLLGGIRYAAGAPRPTAGRRPATPPLYNGSTTGWSQAGPGSFTNTDATLDLVGRHGPALVQREAVHRRTR